MKRARALELLGYAVGTVGALVIGWLGPVGARDLAGFVPEEPTARAVYALAALLLVGTLAGVLGRGIPGAVALWLGLIVAQLAGTVPEPPHPVWLVPFVVSWSAVSIGYLVARAVDPLWSGAGLGRVRPDPATR